MTKPSKNLLAEYGYEIIALPRTDVRPLLLLCKEDNSLTEYGDSVLELFEPDEAGLPIKKAATADINGNQSLVADGSLGVDLLSGLFKALKLKDTTLKGKLGANKELELTFSYEDIQEEKVSARALDDFIAGAIPKKEGFTRSLERLKNSELYLVVSVLKSAAFTVSVTSKNGQNAEIKAAVQEVVDLNPKFTRKKENEFTIKTNDDQPLVFAYKAARIIYDKKKWFEFWKKSDAGFRIKNQKGLVLKDPEDFPIDPLQTGLGISNF